MVARRTSVVNGEDDQSATDSLGTVVEKKEVDVWVVNNLLLATLEHNPSKSLIV